MHSRLFCVRCEKVKKSEKNIMSNFEGSKIHQVHKHSTTYGKLEGMECVFNDINLVCKLRLSFSPILSAFVRFLGDIFVSRLIDL